MKVLCYYHEDLDGICSAAIVVKRYGANDVKCIPVQYNRNTWDKEDVDQAESVYVVDFTFSDMEELVKVAGTKLRWIDHHKTAMEQHNELWNSLEVYGNRDLDRSGCGLTWWYCIDTTIPLAVRFVEDRDLWRFVHDETKAFCAGLNILTDSPYDDIWSDLLDHEDGWDYPENVIQFGEALLKSQGRRIKTLFDNGTDIIFHGYKARMCNTTSYISELGEYICSLPDYDIAVMWQAINDKIIVSLRSNTVDCSVIAQKYGGGGHIGAAGFSFGDMHPEKLFWDFE